MALFIVKDAWFWQSTPQALTYRAFFVTVRAGTAYRHLFSKVKEKNYL